MSYHHDHHDDHDMTWADLGRCVGVDPDVFFPEPGQNSGPAKAYCRACPVRTECLTWALDSGQRHGIWGGMTESQRRRLRRPEPVPSIEPVAARVATARHLHLVR